MILRIFRCAFHCICQSSFMQQLTLPIYSAASKSLARTTPGFAEAFPTTDAQVVASRPASALATAISNAASRAVEGHRPRRHHRAACFLVSQQCRQNTHALSLLASMLWECPSAHAWSQSPRRNRRVVSACWRIPVFRPRTTILMTVRGTTTTLWASFSNVLAGERCKIVWIRYV